jgi:hypothetical protein
MVRFVNGTGDIYTPTQLNFSIVIWFLDTPVKANELLSYVEEFRTMRGVEVGDMLYLDRYSMHEYDFRDPGIKVVTLSSDDMLGSEQHVTREGVNIFVQNIDEDGEVEVPVVTRLTTKEWPYCTYATTASVCGILDAWMLKLLRKYSSKPAPDGPRVWTVCPDPRAPMRKAEVGSRLRAVVEAKPVVDPIKAHADKHAPMELNAGNKIPLMHFHSVKYDGKIYLCSSYQMGNATDVARMWHGIAQLPDAKRIEWCEKQFPSKAKQAVYSYLFRWYRPPFKTFMGDAKNDWLEWARNEYIVKGSCMLQHGTTKELVNFTQQVHPTWVKFAAGHQILALCDYRGRRHYPKAKLGGGFLRFVFTKMNLPLQFQEDWTIVLYLLISVRHEEDLMFDQRTPEWCMSVMHVRNHFRKRAKMSDCEKMLSFLRSEASLALLRRVVPDLDVRGIATAKDVVALALTVDVIVESYAGLNNYADRVRDIWGEDI